MKFRIKTSRRVRAAGSIMEIWPTGNYIEHMPKGTAQHRIGQHFHNVGNRLGQSLTAYEQLKHEG